MGELDSVHKLGKVTRPRFPETLSPPPPESEIEKVQRMSAAMVLNDLRQTACVDIMLKTLQWPTLQSKKKKDRKRLTIFYKYLYGLLTSNTKYLPASNRTRRSTQ